MVNNHFQALEIHRVKNVRNELALSIRLVPNDNSGTMEGINEPLDSDGWAVRL